MSKKATTDLLNELHAALATHFKEVLQGTGEGAPTASQLSVIRQFLKDNDIQAGFGDKDMSEIEKAMKGLNELPLDGEVPDEFRH